MAASQTIHDEEKTALEEEEEMIKKVMEASMRDEEERIQKIKAYAVIEDKTAQLTGKE